jgi:hypothetical protein
MYEHGDGVGKSKRPGSGRERNGRYTNMYNHVSRPLSSDDKRNGIQLVWFGHCFRRNDG